MSLKIELTNFLCHNSAKFEIPLSGMTQIKGREGTGKSSIFEGIYFALYGTTTAYGNSKPQSFGKKSCKVILRFPDRYRVKKIERTRAPNKLVLFTNDNGRVEGQEGQGIIDSEFGNSTVFKCCSYISQFAFATLENNISDLLMTMRQVSCDSSSADVDKYLKMLSKEKKSMSESMYDASSKLNVLKTHLEYSSSTLEESLSHSEDKLESNPEYEELDISNLDSDIECLSQEISDEKANIRELTRASNTIAPRLRMLEKIGDNITQNKAVITEFESNLQELQDKFKLLEEPDILKCDKDEKMMRGIPRDLDLYDPDSIIKRLADMGNTVKLKKKLEILEKNLNDLEYKKRKLEEDGSTQAAYDKRYEEIMSDLYCYFGDHVSDLNSVMDRIQNEIEEVSYVEKEEEMRSLYGPFPCPHCENDVIYDADQSTCISSDGISQEELDRIETYDEDFRKF